MPKIKIIRNNEKLNSEREIGVYIDEEQLGMLDNGETKEFKVKSGEHNIAAKIDWAGSKTLNFEINDNETKEFNVSSFALANRLFRYSKIMSSATFVLLIILYILNIFSVVNVENYLILLSTPIIIPLLIIAYYLSVGKNKYLLIKGD